MRMSKADIARFWSKCDVKSHPGVCWNWRGAIGAAGYGQFRIKGRRESAHRIAYTVFFGRIPKVAGYHGTIVMHTCDNRRCCNPHHLRLGTNHDNVMDAVRKGRIKATRLVGLERAFAIKADTRPYREIAATYGVGLATISRIKSGANQYMS